MRLPWLCVSCMSCVFALLLRSVLQCERRCEGCGGSPGAARIAACRVFGLYVVSYYSV